MNDFRPEVRSLIKSLKNNGFIIVSVNNGEECVEYKEVKVTEFLEEVVATDEAVLKVKYNDKICSLYLVYGNDPGELVADYTDFEPLDEVIDLHYNKWEGRKQPTTV